MLKAQHLCYQSTNHFSNTMCQPSTSPLLTESGLYPITRESYLSHHRRKWTVTTLRQSWRLLSLASDLGWGGGGEGKALKKDFSLSKKIFKGTTGVKAPILCSFLKKSNPCLWNPPPPSIFLVDIHFHNLSSCQSWKFTHSFPIELICFYIHGIAQKKKKEKQRKMGEGNK